jgi:hypothetical protein
VYVSGLSTDWQIYYNRVNPDHMGTALNTATQFYEGITCIGTAG